MSEVLHRTKGEVQAIAASKGLICIIPRPDEFTLDLDGDADINYRVLKCLKDNGVEVLSTLETKSKSGNRHLYLKIKSYAGPSLHTVLKTHESEEGIEFIKREEPVSRLHISVALKIAVQACLGSDPVKEVLSLLRGATWDCPIALFETPAQSLVVEKWRRDCDRDFPSLWMYKSLV